jgi:hypothetical protein
MFDNYYGNSFDRVQPVEDDQSWESLNARTLKFNFPLGKALSVVHFRRETGT